MTASIQDLRLAARGLLRRPFTSGAAVLMLALGLGFNIALFAVVEAVLLRPLPYDRPDQVMMLWTGRNADGTGGVSSYADFLEWQKASRSFSALAAYNISFGTLTGAGDPEEISGSVVSAEFFRVLRAPLFMGRGIEPGDELMSPSDLRPIVLAHSLWIRRFSSDPGVLGRTITFQGRSWRVVGVMAPGFRHPEPFWGATAEYWAPLTVFEPMLSLFANRYLRVIGRLGDDVTLTIARADMDAIGQRLMQVLPATHDTSVVVSPLHDELIGDAKPLTLAFLGATALILLLVATNVVHLLLAHLSTRRSELAIRAALGAGRARLVSLVLSESLVLGLAGGLAGLAVAYGGIRMVIAYGPGNVAGLKDTTLNLWVVGFAVGLAVSTGLACGLWPAWRLVRARVASALDDMRGSSGPETSRRRRLLIATEMALAVPLLLAAVLLVRTLVGLQQVDPGFDPSGAVQFRVSLPAARYENAEQRVAFFQSLIDRLRALPGVTTAGASSSVPLGGLNNTGGSIVYETLSGSLAETGVGTRAVTAGYFPALGVPLRQGRFLSDAATDVTSVVINERAAAALWPGANPIGRRLRPGLLADPPSETSWLTVVGVAGDVRHEALSRSANAEIFQAHQANPWTTMTVIMRTEGRADALAGPVRSAVRDIDPSLPVVNLTSVRAFIDGQLARPMFGAFCALLFGALGLVLAGVGAFAVLWLLIAQRTREIGIRMALGASPRSVARLIIAQSLTPAAMGAGLGALAAIWLSRVLETMLFQVTARDPLALAASVGGVLLVAFAASWLPAWRAMRTDPSLALRTR